MGKIGNYDLHSTFTLIVPEGETATVDGGFDSWNLSITVEFKSNTESKDPAKSTIDIRGIDKDHAMITFRDWVSGIGTATKEPAYLGTSQNSRIDIFFMASHWLIGKTNRLDLQFLTRAQR